MPTNPARRWFAFRLRTLLVVVVLVCAGLAWVGSSLQWIRARHRFLDEFSQQHLGFMWRSDPLWPATAPARLRLFGETGVHGLDFNPDVDPGLRDRAQALFPEAEITEIHRPATLGGS